MKRTAFVPAEYNPFHAGHALQMKMIREQFGFERIVTVMSGDLVQRGGPAVFDKRDRALSALEGGSDLVLLLPFVYSAQTAEMFAWGSVVTAAAAGCTDLCFGAEDPDRGSLLKDAALLLKEEALTGQIRRYVKDGLPYAAARIRALSERSGEDFSFLEKPNNILAFEYIRAIGRLGSAMQVHLIPRVNGLPTASDIRRDLVRDGRTDIRTADDYIREIRGFILLSDPAYLESIQEAFPGIVPRLLSALPSLAEGTERFLSNVNTPSVTSSRIRRYLFNMLLHYTKDDFDFFRSFVPGYIRVLALNGTGAGILKECKDRGGTVIVTKPSDALRGGVLGEGDRRCFEFDIKAGDLYRIESGIRGNELRYTPVVKK